MLVIGCRRSCHRAVIGFGTVQRFTLLPLGFVRLGRLFVLGVNGVVAHRRWRGCLRRTRGATARCPADILTAEGLAAFAALSSLQRLLDELTEHAGLPADRLCRRTRHLPYLPGLLWHGANEAPVGPAYAHTAAPRYFNVRKTTIYGGSNEIQKGIISKMVLGL